MKKNSVLNKEIENMKGNVLGIGDFNKTLVNKINKNTNITNCNILGNGESDEEGKSRLKKMRISDIRRFKHKKINYLICDYNKIDKYLKTFIKDSIYITKDYIYFCTNNEIIKKLYNRYNVEIKEVKCSDTNILIINTKKAKNNRVKECVYLVVDTFDKFVEIITNLLQS